MHKSYISYFCAVCLLLANACNDYTTNTECENGSVQCIDAEGACYKCIEVASNTYWKKTVCTAGFNDTKTGCNEIKTYCKYDYKNDGTCICNPNCINKSECNEDGSCICPESCVYGCDPDGACISKCANGVEVNTKDGTCKCNNDLCKYGCNPDGSCNKISINIECVGGNGINELGECKCHNKCSESCNPDGSCICTGCVNGCNVDGSCICPCGENNCTNNGVCRSLGLCYNDDDCQEYDYCKADICKCGTSYIDQNRCIVLDANHNHLIDAFEAISERKDCRIDNDCSDVTTNGKPFCDSFMGYKCSTRCTKDDQCMEGFICREDGRCTGEYFTTVWSNELRTKLYSNDSDLNSSMRIAFNRHECKESDDCNSYDSETYKKQCIVEVCWDWDEELNNCKSDTTTQDVCCTQNSGLNACKDVENKPIKYYIEYNYSNTNPSPEKDIVIRVKGKLSNFSVVNEYKQYFKEVRSFGLVSLGAFAFEDCSIFEYVSHVDIPDASRLLNMNGMFSDCSEFNDTLEQWDVSNVTTMSGCFNRASKFNQPLNRWNVLAVKYMENMFAGVESGIKTVFNQPLDQWDVSNVEFMSHMFIDSKFNQPIGRWNVSNVKSMFGMFARNYEFNQDISNWHISKVTDIHSMFSSARKFNQDISQWDVNVTNPSEMKNVFNDSGLVAEFNNSEEGAERFETNLCKIYRSDSWSTIRNEIESMYTSGIISYNPSEGCNWPSKPSN